MTLYLRRFQILFLLGLLVSSYLLFHHVSINHGYQTGASFCSIGASLDCDLVARSKYSELFGIPVASFGMFYFLVGFVVALQLKPTNASEQSRSSALLLTLSTLGFLSSIGFFLLSKFAIGTLCLVCCLVYLTTALLFLLAVRSPYRTGTLWADLATGTRESVTIVVPAGSGTLPKVSTVLTWIVAVLGAALFYFAPQLLIELHFQPQLLARFDIKTTGPYVDGWRQTPAVKINIAEGSLTERDFALGSADAPLQIVEFSDFECPHCKKAAEHLKPFVMEHLDKVRFVFKNYPLDHSCNIQIPQPKHLVACKAAAMARCAGAQGEDLFWKMHDTLFQQQWMDAEALDQLPMTIPGLDTERFDSCAESADVMNRVRQDIDAGVIAEVKGTPAIYVNGRLLRAPAPLLPGILTHILHEVEKAAAKRQTAG